MKDGQSVMENDLVDCANKLAQFASDHQIQNLLGQAQTSASPATSHDAYDSVLSSSLQNLILDVKRYSRNYRTLISQLKSAPRCVPISELAKLKQKPTKIEKNKQ